MGGPLFQIHEVLLGLVELHRKLLDVVEAERLHLSEADLKAIHTITAQKQSLIESIKRAETKRIQVTGEIAVLWQKPLRELSLPVIIAQLKLSDAEAAATLNASFVALSLLIQRISEQNTSNQAFIERSLLHIDQMKRNVLGEAKEGSDTYTQKGQKTSSQQGSRLLSKEA